MKSLNGNYYVAARIDDATRETKLYFQVKKSQTVDSYKLNEAFIEMQTGNCIKAKFKSEIQKYWDITDHGPIKHIDLRYHFIREAVEDGKIIVKYVPTDENVSDIFTKPLARPKFAKFVEMLGLRKLDKL